jgi:hypothetical protein
MTNEDKMFHIKNQADRQTLQAFERAVPPKLAREIANDHLGKSVSFPSVPGDTPGRANWVEPNPITPPPGIALMDGMMKLEEALWRRELAQRLGVKAAPNDEPPSAA